MSEYIYNFHSIKWEREENRRKGSTPIIILFIYANKTFKVFFSHVELIIIGVLAVLSRSPVLLSLLSFFLSFLFPPTFKIRYIDTNYRYSIFIHLLITSNIYKKKNEPSTNMVSSLFTKKQINFKRLRCGVSLFFLFLA